MVAAALAIVFLTVTAPLAFANEHAGTAIAHDQLFLNAANWLKASPDPGSVLTTSSAARWTEGLADRNAFDVGPVWLLFDPFQIADAQESYWALNSQSVLTNNQVALSFSGFAAPILSQAPVYTAYIEGVPFPVLRVVPSTLTVNATGITGDQTYLLDAATAPVLSAPVGPTETATYVSQGASLVELARVLPDGSAEITFTVTPVPGESVNYLGFSLAAPPSDSTTLATDKFGGFQVLQWNARLVGHREARPVPGPPERDDHRGLLPDAVPDVGSDPDRPPQRGAELHGPQRIPAVLGHPAPGLAGRFEPHSGTSDLHDHVVVPGDE